MIQIPAKCAIGCGLAAYVVGIRECDIVRCGDPLIVVWVNVHVLHLEGDCGLTVS